MPIGQYPFSERSGWVQDKYGLSWQLILTNPEGDPRPPIVPSMLFVGAIVPGDPQRRRLRRTRAAVPVAELKRQAPKCFSTNQKRFEGTDATKCSARSLPSGPNEPALQVRHR